MSEELNRTCSAFRVCPSTQLITIRLVASVPEGAPLAMSTDGAGDRSDRAPPTPSMTQRPIEGSTREQLSNAVATVRGLVQVLPPLIDRTIWIRPRPGEPSAKA